MLHCDKEVCDILKIAHLFNIQFLLAVPSDQPQVITSLGCEKNTEIYSTLKGIDPPFIAHLRTLSSSIITPFSSFLKSLLSILFVSYLVEYDDPNCSALICVFCQSFGLCCSTALSFNAQCYQEIMLSASLCAFRSSEALSYTVYSIYFIVCDERCWIFANIQEHLMYTLK